MSARSTRTLLSWIGIMSALALAGCKPADREHRPNVSSADVPPELNGYFRPVTLSEQPKSVSEIRRSSAPGDRVVFEGKIMGAEKPFVDRRAIFLVGDPARLTSCDLMEGDTCPTPWDVCCEDPETIRESVATVQLIDENGRVLPYGLRGVGGLRELAMVRVEGVVAPVSTPESLVVDASAIQVLAHSKE